MLEVEDAVLETGVVEEDFVPELIVDVIVRATEVVETDVLAPMVVVVGVGTVVVMALDKVEDWLADRVVPEDDDEELFAPMALTMKLF